MKNVVKTLAVAALALFVLFAALPAMAGTTITGEVGYANELISEDGTVYSIADTEKGDELSAMVGETVQVTGTVEEDDGEKIILVDSFTVVKK
jgi:hypothetical protein